MNKIIEQQNTDFFNSQICLRFYLEYWSPIKIITPYLKKSTKQVCFNDFENQFYTARL